MTPVREAAKPRIRFDARAMWPSWICSGGGAIGWGLCPAVAYIAWEKDRRRREHESWVMTVRGPVTNPTAEKLLAGLKATTAARSAAWWRRWLP